MRTRGLEGDLLEERTPNLFLPPNFTSLLHGSKLFAHLQKDLRYQGAAGPPRLGLGFHQHPHGLAKPH